MFLLSDNTDTSTGMKLVGVNGVVVHSRDEVLSALNKALENGEYGIILYTNKLREIAGDIIADKTERNPRIIFYEIPDRHGYGSESSSIADFVKSSIGIKI